MTYDKLKRARSYCENKLVDLEHRRGARRLFDGTTHTYLLEKGFSQEELDILHQAAEKYYAEICSVLENKLQIVGAKLDAVDELLKGNE